MVHYKCAIIALDAPVRKPCADDLYRGQLVFYPVRSRTPGEESRIIKYRPARLHKIAVPVVHLEWLDEKPSKRSTETLFLNEIVIPDHTKEASKHSLRFPFEVPDFQYEKENTMARPPKPVSARAPVPLIGVAKNKQLLNPVISPAAANLIQMEAGGQALTETVELAPEAPAPAVPSALKPKRSAGDTFDEWAKIGSEIVFVEMDKDLAELDLKVETFEKKLAELHRNHNEHVKELEEQLIRVKQEHQQDVRPIEARLRTLQEEKQRFEKRKFIMMEVRKLI